MAQVHRPPIESGCPDGFQYMHPLMRKNYGSWDYHEHPRPGVLLHVADNEDKIWTVRAGTQRILDVLLYVSFVTLAINLQTDTFDLLFAATSNTWWPMKPRFNHSLMH